MALVGSPTKQTLNTMCMQNWQEEETRLRLDSREAHVSLLFTWQGLDGDCLQAQGNSRFYSAKPPERLTGSHLPHVVIQMPVFMEPLATVIMPTIESLEAAIRTYEWQGGSATIIVCDDGLQVCEFVQRVACSAHPCGS